MFFSTRTELIDNITIFQYYSVIISSLLLVAFLSYEYVRASARIPGFDGPRGLPIVGNLWQLHKKDAPEQYRRWASEHGPVYQVQLGNIPVLIINTAAAAKAILIKNSHATASRPEFYTFHKVRAPRFVPSTGRLLLCQDPC